MKLQAILVGFVAAASANVAQATSLDFQVYGGSRTSTFAPMSTATDTDSSSTDSSNDQSTKTSSKFGGSEYGVAALFEPLPLVPISAGGFVRQQNLKGLTAGTNERVQGLEAGVEFLAWVPAGIFQPFLRGGYVLYGSHRYSMSDSEAPFFGNSETPVPTRVELEGNVSGYHGALGIRLRTTPLFGAFLEGDYGKEVFAPKRASITQDGFGFTADAADVGKFKLESRALMLGIEVGT